jgi:hypothetical protein
MKTWSNTTSREVEGMNMRSRRATWILSLLLYPLACSDDGGATSDTLASGTTGSDGDATSGSGSGSGGSGGSEGSSTTGAPADSSGGTDTGEGPPCASPDECGGATPACDAEAGVCTGCTSDTECGEIFCDVATGICRDCVTDDHCEPNAPVCDPVSGQCTATCESSLDCVATGGPGVCNMELGVCTDCTGNGEQCSFCELETFSCVGCLEDTDCPPAAPFCGPSLECSPECSGDDDCPGGLFCDPATSRCVECVTNEHCPGEICQENLTCG